MAPPKFRNEEEHQIDWPRNLSHQRPLLLLGWDPVDPDHGWHDAEWMVASYRLLGLDAWTETAMVVGDRSPAMLDPYCLAADQAGVPLVLQVRTWSGEWLPAWWQWYVSVADWQDLARRHASVVGAQVVE